jgi:uncharacterized protein (DUF1697 family)
MARYAAFLRGINVGGHNPVPMHELTQAFSSLQFKNVRTLLASGNVLFEAPRASAAAFEGRIEKRLRRTFGREISVLVRTKQDLEQLSASQPFGKTPLTPQTRLYVTFLSAKPRKAFPALSESLGGHLLILRVSRRAVFSVLTLSSETGSVDLMQALEQRFGRRITTRSWQTIVRVLNALQQ